jgi:flagellar basal body-associated protein FliL
VLCFWLVRVAHLFCFLFSVFKDEQHEPTKNTTQKTKKMSNTDPIKNTTQKTKKMSNTDPPKNRKQKTFGGSVLLIFLVFCVVFLMGSVLLIFLVFCVVFFGGARR